MITREQLKRLLSNNNKPIVNDEIIDGLLKTMDKYGISENDKRIAMFLAQVAHESGGFRFMVESLRMSAERIMKVWPSRFPTLESAKPYAFNPERLANRVYANRMGNGPEESGDGFRYRGRGFIQLTGKSNYEAFARSQGMSLSDVISYLETYEGACESAGWFWHTRNLNALADAEDVVAVTKRINGGLVGINERILLFETFKEKLRKIREEDGPGSP